MLRVTLSATPIGTVTVLWSPVGGSPLVREVLLPGTPVPEGLTAASCGPVDAVCDRILAMLAGEEATVPLAAVDLSGRTPFERSVLTSLHGVPRGAVTTYGLLAAHAGSPGGARAVGGVMAANPLPLVIPCHRVVRSDGTLGGFGGGEAMKRALLAMEGIAVDAAGRVLVPLFHYGSPAEV